MTDKPEERLVQWYPAWDRCDSNPAKDYVDWEVLEGLAIVVKVALRRTQDALAAPLDVAGDRS